MKISLKDVRISFPTLFTPKAVNGEGEPRFSAAFAIEPGSENAKVLDAAVKQVAKEKWEDKAAGVYKELKGKGRICYREEPLSKDGEVYDGFEGMHALNASNKIRPLVIDRDKSPLSASDGRPYGGCYVNVQVDVWAQDNNWGKRINATLMGVQFNRDGEAFGGARSASEDDFEALAETSAADDFA